MNETLADAGEFALIERVTADVVRGPQVLVGPGDDAAVLSVDGALVASTDVFVEHVHFRTDWSSAEDVGHKAIAAAVADIEAMGAIPTGVLIAFSAPKTTQASWVEQCVAGALAECADAHVSLVGGDLSGGQCVSLAVTALGQTGGNTPILRSGARAGDAVAYKGRLGWAAAGLAVLSRGFRSPRMAVQAYQRPQVPYGAGLEAFKNGATALIDTSDGLMADLGHIAQASGVVIDIDFGCLDIPDVIAAVAQASGHDVRDFILGGGEDHALVGTFGWGEVPSTWTVIGQVVPADNQDPAVLLDGQTWLGERGWSHF
ncbi:MAG: thiamine-phosphate kinase [Propionibacteriaceae bacterium]|jgi:thiamine-monophosphate kinase|nr:thiamine-phosphate kinase [Propionibacteriaceae bacterium]